MHHSFAMFQKRSWDIAFSSIRQAQGFARQCVEAGPLDICHLTEAAYLWHLGEETEARKIYDEYIDRYRNSEDFLDRINEIITRLNYAIIELVFGDIDKARRHVDSVYGERTRFNLSRLMPMLLSLMGVIYGRTNEIQRGIEFTVESLKQTYSRGSSREGQINMEWACGLLVVGGMRLEAWQVLEWVKHLSCTPQLAWGRSWLNAADIARLRS